MTIGYRAGSQTYVFSTNVVVSKPTGTVDGDLLVVGLSTRVAATTGLVTAVPTDWQLLHSTTTATDPGPNVYVYWKIADNEPASWTWTFNNDLHNSAVCVALSSDVGFGATSLSVNSQSGITNTNITSKAVPSLSRVTSADWHLILGFQRDVTTGTSVWTTPTNYTAREAQAQNFTNIAAFTRLLSSVTSTGSFNLTQTRSGRMSVSSIIVTEEAPTVDEDLGGSAAGVSTVTGAITKIGTPKAKVATLVDAFDAKDTALWTWAANPTVSGGQAHFPANAYGYGSTIDSTDRYDLTGSAITIQIAGLPTKGGSTTDGPGLVLELTSSVDQQVAARTSVQFQTNLSDFTVDATPAYRIAGTLTFPSYTTRLLSTHKWWRIAHDGTNVVWTASTDGVTWDSVVSVAASTITGFDPADVRVSFRAFADAANTGTFDVEHVNVTSSGVAKDLAGSASASSTTSSALARVRSVAGSATGGSGATGTPYELSGLAGVAAGVATSVAVVAPVRALVASSSGTATVAATDLSRNRWVAGAAGGTSSAAALLGKMELLDGSASGLATAAGDPHRITALSGAADGDSDVMGSILAGSANSLSSVSVGQSTVTGDLDVERWLVAASDGAGTLQADDLGRIRALDGAGQGQAGAEGLYERTRELSGQAMASSMATGSVSGHAELGGSSGGGSSVVGDLITAVVTLLEAASGGVSTVGAALVRIQMLVGNAAGQSELASDLHRVRGMAGQGAGVSSVSGRTTADYALAGLVVSESSVVGALRLIELHEGPSLYTLALAGTSPEALALQDNAITLAIPDTQGVSTTLGARDELVLALGATEEP